MAAAATSRPKALTGLDLLLRLMDSEIHRVRQDGVELARRLGAKAAPATKRLIELLADRPEVQSSVALSASTCLGGIGPAAAEAIPSLVNLLEDTNAHITLRRNAAANLGKIDPDGARVLPALKRAIESKYASLTIGAALGVEAIGPQARSLETTLRARLERADGAGTRHYLKRALKALE